MSDLQLFQQFKKALSEYLEANRKLLNFLDQFTVKKNGIIVRETIESFNWEEFDKINNEVEGKRNEAAKIEEELKKLK